MTDEPPMTVKLLRELFRNLQPWENLSVTYGLRVLTFEGVEYHLEDVQYLYSKRYLLSPRQREAIEMFLYDDIKERDAALLMGVSPTNPVAMYATDGLTKLVGLLESGALSRHYDPQRIRQKQQPGNDRPISGSAHQPHEDQKGVA